MKQVGLTKFFLERLFINCRIPCYVYDKNQKIKYIIAEDNYSNALECDAELRQKLVNASDKSLKPIIYIEVLNVYWGIVKTKSKGYIFWGPVSLVKMNNNVLSYRHMHNITNCNYFMKQRSIEKMANILSLAYYEEYGEKIEEQDIPTNWNGKPIDFIYDSEIRDIEEYQLEKSETDRISTGVQYEERFLKIVEDGDIKSMRKMMQVNAMDLDGMGKVADKVLKKMEYLCVSSVVLVSRAAIRGGMNSTMAYDLSDVYLKKLEKCNTLEEMGLVCAKMQMDYTERVHQSKKLGRGNLYVEKTKDYIANHLRKPFQIQEMSEELKVNRTYLAKIFREHEHMTIHQYIIKEKCEHAANMLRFTDYSLSIISEYFCFATQSHFGQKFKKVYGISPNEYRRRYHLVEDFVKDKNK